MSISRSLITGQISRLCNTKSMLNPIKEYFVETKIAGEALDGLTDDYLKVLDRIKNEYGELMADRKYEKIPRSKEEYVNLLGELRDIKEENSAEAQLTLLLEIAETALTGSYNSLTLYGENIVTGADKVILENKIETILSEVNRATTLSSAKITNSFTITQNVKLAPLYNYYILIYGVPCADEGFDPEKLLFLSEVLVEKGIDPYV